MLDGKKVGHYELAPGHSDYHNQLFYQIYDITEHLADGTHTIGAYVADGWYRGRIGFAGDNCQYGDELALLLQLELEYADGEQEFICSDENFQITEGGYVYADIMVGEKYDARLEKNHFFENGYTDPHVRHPRILQEDFQNLRAEYKNHIEVIETLCPQAVYQLNPHEIMLGFGKNVAGKVGIHLHEKAGQEIRIEHSEVEGPGHTFLKNIIAASFPI